MKKIANVYSFKVIVTPIIIFLEASDIKSVFSLLLLEVFKMLCFTGS
jgi:hypothetical protein